MSKCCLGTKRYYYKYEYDTFEQPVLTSNGVVDSNSFAVFDNIGTSENATIFQAFDSNLTNYSIRYKSQGGGLNMYNPNPLNITLIKVKNSGGGSWGVRSVLTGQVLATNNKNNFKVLKNFSNSISAGGGEWEIDLSDNENYYTYYRIVGFTTSYGNAGASDQVFFADIKLTATEQKIIESTEEDYDFYLDKPIALLNKNEDNEFIAYKY